MTGRDRDRELSLNHLISWWFNYRKSRVTQLCAISSYHHLVNGFANATVRLRFRLKIMNSNFLLFITRQSSLYGIQQHGKICYTSWNLCSRLSKMWSILLHDIQPNSDPGYSDIIISIILGWTFLLLGGGGINHLRTAGLIN